MSAPTPSSGDALDSWLIDLYPNYQIDYARGIESIRDESAWTDPRSTYTSTIGEERG